MFFSTLFGNESLHPFEDFDGAFPKARDMFLLFPMKDK